MVVQDFIASASASAAHIAKPEYTLGERIYKSVEATWAAVGCNTNLGIVLLCAPIIQSLINEEGNLKQSLSQVLASTTVEDAQWTFDAIQLANPGGLGASAQQDVNQKATCTLLEAMALAAERDSVALQYQQQYRFIFQEAVPYYENLLQNWQRPAWATTGLYLYLMTHFLDSHIVRKYNQQAAQKVSQQAEKHLETFLAFENPKLYLTELLTFDHQLKTQGYNPGTSADLTVATVLLHHFVNNC